MKADEGDQSNHRRIRYSLPWSLARGSDHAASRRCEPDEYGQRGVHRRAKLDTEASWQDTFRGNRVLLEPCGRLRVHDIPLHHALALTTFTSSSSASCPSQRASPGVRRDADFGLGGPALHIRLGWGFRTYSFLTAFYVDNGAGSCPVWSGTCPPWRTGWHQSASGYRFCSAACCDLLVRAPDERHRLDSAPPNKRMQLTSHRVLRRAW